MVMHPEVQRKAQAEIDRVIGGGRLPTLADQPNLPYVDALVKEVFRWQQVVPLGKLEVFSFLSEVTGWRPPLLREKLIEVGPYQGYHTSLLRMTFTRGISFRRESWS